MMDDLETLEREIACGKFYLSWTGSDCEGFQERYEEFQQVLPIAEEDIIARLQDIGDKVDEKLRIADSFMRESSGMDSSGEKSRLAISAQDRILRKKLSELSECRQLLDKVQEIEGLLIASRSDTVSEIVEAKNLLECETQINEITKDDGWPILTGRKRDILREEVSFMMTSLKYKLSCGFDEFVSYPATEVKGTVHMHIRSEKPTDVGQLLTALNLLGELDSRLKKWAAYVVKNFVQPIVDSGDGVDPYERFVVTNGTAEFTASSKIRSANKGISVEGVVSGLLRFFSNLATSIQGIEVSGRPLALFLGQFFQDDLMAVFLKNCVAASVPVPDPDGSKLRNAMENAENFREEMIKLEFFNDATPTFQVFSEQHFTVFIDRRCLEVIRRSKELICMPYLELAEVRSGLSFVIRSDVRPTTKSTVDLMELVFATLEDAINTDNEKLSGRLALTARNILQLFELTAPRHHGTAISSMPQMAAIFYNNCFYICHRLMMMPFGILKNVDKKSAKYASFRPILSDSLWKLREIAADMLEQTMRQCRRDISVMLNKDDLFVKIDDLERCDATKDVLNACLMHVQNVSHLLKEVLAEMVYSQTMANIVSFFLDSICDVILRLEDIRSVDADISAKMIETLLSQLGPIFMVNGRSSIHEVCSTSYFRTKEIIFCLKGSLQSIDDRWCSAKGPLAQWLQASEVRSLIKALFMNTEQRRQLLDSIF
ncbi:Centromere/kinetochore Zw10 [Ancylostoma caninum]|uniref:Centromere/kinetochore Zw10 n=1 Tax=Ancylostoma caninum TaxID=29170 RepID=A0A368FQ82_ANCCA|nr:Centromere/kinetochore Zw10 [Ancylostoma caninum]